MSKLTSLCGKLKEEVIIKDEEGNEVTVVLKAPLIEDIDEIFEAIGDGKDKNFSPKQMVKLVNVLKRMILRSIPDATEEEVNEVIVSNLTLFSEALLKLVNKSLGVSEKKLNDKTKAV